MEYPVEGRISIGNYMATSEEDLKALFEHVKETYGEKYAAEIAELYPEVFVQTYEVLLTQDELDLVHILLGYVSTREAFALDAKLVDFVSKDSHENYDRLSWIVDSEDGLNLKID